MTAPIESPKVTEGGVGSAPPRDHGTSGPRRPARTSGKLVGLLRAATRIQEARTEQEAIQRTADAVREAGWSSVVVCLFDRWSVTHRAYAGVSEEEIEYIEANPPTPEKRAEMYGPEFARYRVSRSYFISADEVMAREDGRPLLPGRRVPASTDSWQPHDVAYVPLYAQNGEVVGTISLDDPVDGTRPTLEVFRYLEFFADLVVRTVQHLCLEEELRARIAAERRLRAELNHRVRNNLASLLTLVELTSRSAVNVAEFSQSIRHRTQTMVAVHGLLSTSHWRAVRLDTLLASLAWPEAPGALHVEGVEVEIPARQVQALAMVINELIVNSFKHGALGAEGGRVCVQWTVEDAEAGRQLRIDWSEIGGPRIEGERRAGSGCDLVRGLVCSELGGSVELEFPADGARHVIEIVLAEAAEPAPAPAGP